jgi:poly(hydroxyalkanoate) depolymerase family esterase
MPPMRPIDWSDLYAANRAVIERSRNAPGGLPAGLRAPGHGPPSPSPEPIGRSRHAFDGHDDGDARTFTMATRTRRAMVHVSARAQPGTALPLVCLLHGCTQDASSFAAATLMNEAADRHGFIAVYPEQERADNPQGCWNWFLPAHQQRGAGEPQSIAALVRELIGTPSRWTIDPRRVFVAGLSAGGAMAAVLAATHPDLFAALAVHSGLPYGAAMSAGTAFAAMSRGSRGRAGQGGAVHAAMGLRARTVPTLVIHGSADRTVAPVNGEEVLDQWMTANRLASPEACDLDIAHPSSRSKGRVPGGYAYTHSEWTDRHGAPTHGMLAIDGLGHAWSGGAPGGSYTDPRGPDATATICRFFERVGADRAPG